MIDSLAIIDQVLVIAQVCQRERRGSEEDRRTDGREVGADAGWFRRDVTKKGTGRGTDEKKETKRAGEGGQQGGVKSSNNGSRKQSSFC